MSHDSLPLRSPSGGAEGNHHHHCAENAKIAGEGSGITQKVRDPRGNGTGGGGLVGEVRVAENGPASYFDGDEAQSSPANTRTNTLYDCTPGSSTFPSRGTTNPAFAFVGFCKYPVRWVVFHFERTSSPTAAGTGLWQRIQVPMKAARPNPSGGAAVRCSGLVRRFGCHVPVSVSLPSVDLALRLCVRKEWRMLPHAKTPRRYPASGGVKVMVPEPPCIIPVDR